MSARVRIKAGRVEFEYEGETEFSINDIKELFSHIETLFTVPEGGDSGEGDGEETGPISADNGGGAINLHINAIAAKLGVKTGPDLVNAAAARLELADARQSFSRKELLATMRNAPKYFKKSMGSNLTTHITSLITSGKFNQIADDEYSLTSAEHERLKKVLA